jgi:hypothetical protein
MAGFGKRIGGGRRTSTRETLPLLASLKSVSRSYEAVLVDISPTGARLRGTRVPPVGEGVLLRVGPVEAMGTVRWFAGENFGLEFDSPLRSIDVSTVRNEVLKARGRTPEDVATQVYWSSQRLS